MRWSAHATGAAIPVGALFDWLARQRHAGAGLAGRPDASWRQGRLQAQRAATRRRQPTCASCSSVGAMQALYDVPAPAKLNLFLHVTGRRRRRLSPAAVGLHADRLVRHAAFRAAGPTASSAARTWATALPADDLVLRAARALQQASAHRPGRPHRHRQAPARRRRAWAAAPRMRPAACWRSTACGTWTCRWPALAADRPGAGRRRAFFPARAQRLGRRHRRADHARSTCRRRASPWSSRPQGLDTADIFSDPALKRDSDACYNFWLCCKPVWFWCQRLAAGCPKALPRRHPGPSMAGFAGLARPDDRLGQRGFPGWGSSTTQLQSLPD